MNSTIVDINRMMNVISVFIIFGFPALVLFNYLCARYLINHGDVSVYSPDRDLDVLRKRERSYKLLLMLGLILSFSMIFVLNVRLHISVAIATSLTLNWLLTRRHRQFVEEWLAKRRRTSLPSS